MAERKALIIEDEPDIAELIRFHIDREGFVCETLNTGATAIDMIRRMRPDLVVLDLMLPEIDGLEICRRVRWDPDTREIPILIVSAKGDDADIVTGLELGADDYVTKPFSPKVLMARVRNLMRRSSGRASVGAGDDESRLSFGDGRLKIDADRRMVTVDDTPIELTASEFDILRYLARRPGYVRTRDQIIAAVRGDHVVLSSRTVDVHMTAVRRKLGELGSWIHTVRGVGYRFSADSVEGD